MSAAALEQALLGAVPTAIPPRPLLLLGPASSGRSALLFRAALVAAAASPTRVLFLAPRPLERLPGGGATATGAIQRIHFLYPPSFRELFQLVASLHENVSGTPSLIVLDGLEEYLGRCPGPHRAAQLVALLLDTANHFSQKPSVEPAGCQLIVSMRLPEEAGEETEQLSAIERYFPARCWLHPEAGESSSSDSLGFPKLVRAHLSQPGTKDQEWLVRFDPQGDMRTSLLPGQCESDRGIASGNHPMVPGTHSQTSGGP
ncbi:ATPase SWSAP1 [Hemicordylus capensis]|uniref:ATPase SWSAP1 n=1 Tax=Hemicordylus capensis TaxID=884348 RepID=UPI002303DCDF|nr:ATPase SWSAP1 [Hemicordylus capensis]